ncbi:DinB family protein [Deinococcus kurensis]|uniref:DinB family protein n=1 Tax=Deinococcus kurensis TaxID=2662757 RepID=UPI0012D2D077|nr:DinB family protein [Deinococcus kurensis]
MESMERMMRINGRINAALIDGLNPEHWELTDGLGGQSIGHQLAHIAHFRYGWLRAWAPGHLGAAEPAFRQLDDGSLHLIPEDAAALKQVFERGDEAAWNAVQRLRAAGETVKGYADPAMMLARTLAHDANHRGQIMTIMRIHGLERTHIGKAMYGLWGEE